MYMQTSFGWGEEDVCRSCGKRFLHVFPSPFYVYGEKSLKFHSVLYCTRECSANGIRKIKQSVERERGERKKWG